MNDLIKFEFEKNQVRTIVEDGEPWFVAKDVCEVIEIEKPRNAYSRLEDDEKGVRLTGTLGGQQEMVYVNESGMYALIMQSRKPAAKRFRKWVTSEVLPSIRKTGSYGASTSPELSVPEYVAMCKEHLDLDKNEMRDVLRNVGKHYGISDIVPSGAPVLYCEDMTDFERLDAVRQYYKLNQSGICKKLGISTSYYSDMKKGISGVSAKVISAVASRCEEINVKWFSGGGGQMLA